MNKSNKKILITGGAGYIGSHIVTLLGKNNYDFVVLDNLSTGRKDSVLFGELVVGSLEDHDFVDQLMKKYSFDAVIHFAGSIIVPESVTDPIKYYKNNTENSLNLISLCLKNKINKFIFSSTAAVYGYPEGGIATEESLKNPINPYGRSKLMTEWMLEDVSNAHDFNYVALRYFNVAGANVEGLVGQCSKTSTHLLKIASETALGKRTSMSVFGTDYETRDGTCIRDYIHADDLAQAHLDALTYLQNGGKSEILNCGYGEGFTVNEVITRVKKITGVDFKVEHSPRRAGDPGILMSKADKIKKVLGFKPKYNDLDLIIKTAVDWEKKL
jgi:UDP-glucose 4-epimerase